MPSHYRIYKSSKGGYYSFTTQFGVKYRCFFTQNRANDLMGFQPTSPVYFFGFSKKIITESECFAPIISLTIVEIFNRFFSKNDLGILCFICDNTDLKARKRMLVFSRWMKSHNNDAKKTMIRGEIEHIIYAGVILMANHPEKSAIKAHFDNQLKEYRSAEKNIEVTTVE